MNKETQIANLNTLADFIEANPNEYNQHDAFRCVLGLGARLVDGKLISGQDAAEAANGDFNTVFEERFGVTNETSVAINGTAWCKIDSRFSKNLNPTPADAVELLRWIAEQKTLDKLI